MTQIQMLGHTHTSGIRALFSQDSSHIAPCSQVWERLLCLQSGFPTCEMGYSFLAASSRQATAVGSTETASSVDMGTTAIVHRQCL